MLMVGGSGASQPQPWSLEQAVTLVSLVSGTAKAVKLASDAALAVAHLRSAITSASSNKGEIAVTNLSERTIRLQVDADNWDRGGADPGAAGDRVGFSRLLEPKEKTGCFRSVPTRAYIDGRPVGSLNPGSIYIFDIDEVLREYVTGEDMMLYEKDPWTGELFADALDGSSHKPCLGELPGPQHMLHSR